MELKIINIQAITPRSKKIVNAFDITLNGEKLNMAVRTQKQEHNTMDFYAIEPQNKEAVLKIISDTPQEATRQARKFFNSAAVHVKPQNEWFIKPFATITQGREYDN